MELNLLITRLFSSSLNEIYNNSSLYIYYTDLHFEFIQNYWIALYIYILYRSPFESVSSVQSKVPNRFSTSIHFSSCINQESLSMDYS